MPFPQGQTETAPALSTRIFNVLATRFPPETAPLIAGALSEAFPGVAAEGPLRERVQAALLRLALEHDGLERALELAHIDYRDLLVSAGFASDEGAHRVWLDAAAGALPSVS